MSDTESRKWERRQWRLWIVVLVATTFATAFVASGGCLLLSCGESDPASDFCGTWSGDYELGGTLTFTFRPDGTFTQSYSGVRDLATTSIEGTWQTIGDDVVVTPFLDVDWSLADDATENAELTFQYRQSASAKLRIGGALFGPWALEEDHGVLDSRFSLPKTK